MTDEPMPDPIPAGEPDPEAGGLVRVRAGIQGAIQAAMRHEALWGIAGAAMLTLLLARTPLGLRFEGLVVGQPAPRDIVVPVTVEIPDAARTAVLREEARRRTAYAYVFDPSAARRAEQTIAAAFEAGRRALSTRGGRGAEAAIAAAQAVLPPGVGTDVAETLARAGFPPEREKELRATARALGSEMIVARADSLPSDRPISVRTLGGDNRETLLTDFDRVLDLDAARKKAREKTAAEPVGPEGELARAEGAVLASVLEPSLTPDSAATSARMEEAARAVPVLLARIERGTVLARRGFPLTEETVATALAIQAARPRRLEPGPLAGTAGLCALLFGFLWVYARTLRPDRGRTERLYPQLVLLVVVMVGMAWVMLYVSSLVVDRFEPPFDRVETLVALIPVASGGLLAALLFSGRTAMVYSVFFSVPYAILAGWDLRVLAYSLVTHFAAISGARAYRTRTALLRAGFIVGFCGAAAAVALDLCGGIMDWRLLSADALAALAGGGIGAAIVVSFLLPICEWVFNVLTDVRLLELLNRDNPLLSRLAAAAPGSYNHSLIVGTLAEAAAESIGANGLYCRVAAVYHDIGKMKMPEYYIENQRPGENPHDRITPSLSKVIIENHVKEGMRLARLHGLPDGIAAVIPEHHGTRVMTYFYEKARKEAAPGDPPPDPDAFRYPGPKPRSRETAIFMLADSVEAASRTIDRPDGDKFREMIRQIAGRVVLDGQFDECDLTFHDLERVIESFVSSLVAIYHRRVDYPTYVFERSRRRGRTADGSGRDNG